MAFPVTEWPAAFDAAQTRVDGMDTVYDDDFNYTDDQIRNLQHFCGLDGDLIGQNVSGGPGGMASPIASGGTALTLAAKAAFVAGSILQVGDNYGVAFVPKLDLSHDGVLYALGGIDASEELWIPHGALPLAGSEGRLVWDPATSTLNYDDGLIWNAVGGGAGGAALDLVTMYSYTEAPAPVEEVIGDGFFDGAMASGSMLAYFRATVDPSLSAGSLSIKLYDMGPKAGPLDPIPRLVSTLSTSANGLQVLELLLTVVSALPAGDEILDVPRLYEIVVTSAAVAGDTAMIMSTGFDVR